MALLGWPPLRLAPPCGIQSSPLLAAPILARFARGIADRFLEDLRTLWCPLPVAANFDLRVQLSKRRHRHLQDHRKRSLQRLDDNGLLRGRRNHDFAAGQAWPAAGQLG